MRRRWLILLSILLLPLLAAAVILFTGPGLRLAWDMTRDLVPGKISAEHISGRLVGPIEITGLNWRQDQRQLRIDQARIEWQPRALLSRHLHINNLRASGVLWQDSTPASDSTNTEPFTLPRLPIQITADAVDIKTVRVEQADSEFVIDDIQLAGRTNDEAYELTFTAEAEQLETAGEARIELESPNALVLASDWHYLPPETDGISARLNLGGSLERLEIDLETDGELSATVGGTLTQLFEQPTFAGNVEVRNIAPRLSGLPDERVSAELTVNAQATDIAANGRIDIPALLPRPVIVNGALNMGEGFRLQPTTVSLADAPGTVTVSGDVDPATQGVDVELAWQQLQWPLVGKAQWRSTNGTGTLQGSFDDYRFSANGNIGNPTLPPLQIAARGTGNTGAVTLERLVATTTDSRERATASGRIGWQDTTSARLDVELVAIDIRRLHPDLRGEMSATTRVAVNLPASGAVVDVAIARLDGNLNGRPLDGKGAIRIEGEDIRVRELELRAGEARLLANGAVASDQVNLDWDLFVPELARLWPGFAGRIASRGRATGNRANPQLDGDIDASDIAIATVRIGELQGDLMTGLSTDSTVEIDLTAKNVAVGELVAGDIQLGIAGRASDHTIAIDLDGPHSELTTQLQGALADNDWQGRVQQLRFSHPQFEPLQLAAPAPLLVGPGRLETTALCLTQQTSSLCIDGAAATGSEDELQIQLTDLPLATFALLLPPGLEYDGVIDGDATLTLASGTPTGRAELRLEQGQVITREDGNPETLIAYENGRVEAQIANNQLDAQVQLDLRDAGRINADLLAPLDNSGALSGNIDINIVNLSMIPALLPQVSRVDGRIEARLAIGGRLRAPDLSGRVALSANELVLPDFGLNLAQTQLVVVTAGDKIEFDGNAKSGDGSLQLNGELRWQGASPSGQLKLVGERFRAIDLPEVRVDATPDIDIVVADREISVRGTVNVPSARITPVDFDRGVPVSADQVIVSREQPAAESAQSQWRLNGNMLVTAGDNVQIRAFGLEGRLTGSVRIIDQPGKPTTARGSLEIIEGKYEAYGQALAIETGKLEFTGGTLDDPGLDLRASRMSDEVIAGVQVRGALRQPTLKLYSSPAMSDSQAMSYLVTGRRIEDLDQDGQAAVTDAATRLALQGGGSLLANSIGRGLGLDTVDFEDDGTTSSTALVVGKQLSPRLYVSYGIGLFEAINTLRLRYRINRRLTLQTESGESTSADLLYTFER